jgi:hypothetical protein
MKTWIALLAGLVVASTAELVRAGESFFIKDQSKRTEEILPLNQENLLRVAKEYGVGMIMPKSCPATLLGNNQVLVAAHCVIQERPG